MKFPYLKFNLLKPSKVFGNFILRPVVPIRIRFEDNSVRYAALLDSGADFCLFDAELGEYLGIDILKGIREEFGGVQETRKGTVYFHEITIEIGGINRKILAGFSHDIAKRGYGVLGQKEFFDIFVVKFDLAKEEIELKPRVKKK